MMGSLLCANPEEYRHAVLLAIKRDLLFSRNEEAVLALGDESGCEGASLDEFERLNDAGRVEAKTKPIASLDDVGIELGSVDAVSKRRYEFKNSFVCEALAFESFGKDFSAPDDPCKFGECWLCRRWELDCL